MNPKPHNQAAQNYLRTRVLTATPEQLQMMLFDGVLYFAKAGKTALEKKDYEQTYYNLTSAQKIVSELICTLKHDVHPELCGRLASLYQYAYKKLVEASIKHNMESMDEAINVLTFQRETWSMLLQQIGKQKAGLAAKNIAMPAPDSRMEASISMSA
jgi:flagellar secretion chaperone FliS